MALQVFKKRGKPGYKDQRMIDQLTPKMEKYFEEHPEELENFQPATNSEELKALHLKYCAEDAEFEEIDESNQGSDSSAAELESDSEIDFNDDTIHQEEVVDPLLKENPVVRDYVMQEDKLSEHSYKTTGREQFEEPMSFGEAFEIPDFEEISAEQPEEPVQQHHSSSGKKQTDQKRPVNPDFDSMSASKQKKSTKKFAKYIVETTCMLTEKGTIWFATKDINESKLAEYELTGEIDTSILLTLSNDQEVTIRDYFMAQCKRAEELAKVSEEEKEDLTLALADVLMEKGIAPTASQELMLITFSIIGKQVVSALAIRAETNSVLNQLRAMRSDTPEPQQREYYEPQQVHEEPEEPVEEPTNPVIEPEPIQDKLDIEKVEETIE